MVWHVEVPGTQTVMVTKAILAVSAGPGFTEMEATLFTGAATVIV